MRSRSTTSIRRRSTRSAGTARRRVSLRTSRASSSTTTVISSSGSTSRSRPTTWRGASSSTARSSSPATTRAPSSEAPIPTCPPQPNAAPAAIYGLGVEPTIIRFAPFVWSNRGELVDDDENPTRFTLDSAASKSALQQFFELRTLHGVVPPDVEVEAEDDETRFLNGRMGMLLESRRLVPALREAATFDWDVAALADAAGRGEHPPLGRLLHDEGLQGEGRRVALRRVRARPGGGRGDRRDRAHGAVPARGGGVRRVPRPGAEAGQLARCSSTRSRRSGTCRRSRRGRRSRTPPSRSSRTGCTARSRSTRSSPRWTRRRDRSSPARTTAERSPARL